MRRDSSVAALIPTRARPVPSRSLVPALAWWPVLLVTLCLGCALEVEAVLQPYHGDELYFLASAQHLSGGYADQGFLVPFLAWLGEHGGDSPWLVRAPAVLATMAGVVLTALIARQFGGGRWTQTIAAATYCASPRVVDTGSLLLTQTFDVPLWIATILLLVTWARTGRDRLFWSMGLVAGIACMVKPLIAVFWVCCVAVLLIRGGWRLLKGPLWALIVPAVAGAAPYLLWQGWHGFPQLTLIPVVTQETSEFAGGRLTALPLTLVANGALVGSILAIYGCWTLLRDRRLAPYRFLGWTCVAVVAVIVLTGGRYYYCAGLFPLCWAAAVWRIGSCRRLRRWRSFVSVAVSAGTALIVLLISLMSTVPSAPRWVSDVTPEARSEHGWSQFTETVADAYSALPADIRDTTAIVTDHYWQASALNWFGPAHRLPTAYSPHRGFWYFGRPPDTDRTVMFVGPEPTWLGTRCTLLTATPGLGGRGFAGLDQDVPVWLCDGPRQPWEQLWPHLRHA